jgi:tetratricopeptide (TPR) repeat protein
MNRVRRAFLQFLFAFTVLGIGGRLQEVRPQTIEVPPEVSRIPAIASKEVMERPIGRTPDAGRLHQKVTTASTEAQAYYDQGIAFLHSYVWVDAARSFYEALRRDPELAMAELGLAKAYFNGEAFSDAFIHLRKARELAARGKGTSKENKWIALAKQQMDAIFAPPEERTKKHEEYKKAIDELIAMDTDDAHAWVLRGNAEEASPAGRGQGGRVGSIAYYDAALKRDPNHWGADHYLIHSYEGLGLYMKSADHGAKYAAAVSGVPHAQHMYAHVLPRLGKWETALIQLQKADRVQRSYFAQGIAPVEEWHHGHNIHLLGSVHLRLGHDKEAEQYLREAFYLENRSLRDGRFTDPWLEFLLLRGRDEEALKAALGAEQRPLALARLSGSVRAAEALIALGRIDEAREAQKRAKVNLLAFQKDIAVHPMYAQQGRSYEETLFNPLEAQFALLGPNSKEGEEQLVKLADRFANEKGLDGWVTGLFRLHQLARVAQRSGKTKLAEELLERVRRIDAGYVGSVQATIGH